MIQPLTVYGLVGVILLIDLYFYCRGGKEATITAWIQATKTRCACAAFGLGLLFGHLFL